MNFGAFSGGLAQGFNQGVKMGKDIREMIKEQGLREIREKGMAEAEAARSKAADAMIKTSAPEPSSAPTSGPIDNTTPPAEAPAETAPTKSAQEISAASPTASPDAAAARTAASAVEPSPAALVSASSPTANPDAAGAASAAAAMPQGSQLPPSVSTQAPAADAPAPTAQETPQQSAAASPVQAVAATGVKGNIPGQTGFWANGQRYNTREQARAATEKSLPSTMDFFMKNAVPKIAQQYVVDGDPEKAKAWADYAESHNGKRAIKEWADAYSAPDFDTAVDRFGTYYTNNINDGIDFAGHKMVTKADGTQVAVVTLKDKATGKTSEMELTREKMLALGGANNPQHLFETEQAKQREADKLKTEYALKSAERRGKLDDMLTVEKAKAGYKAESDAEKAKQSERLERLKSQLGVQADASKRRQDKLDTIEEMTAMGMSDDEIKSAFVRKFSGSDAGKEPHSTTVRLEAYNKLSSDGNMTKYPTTDDSGKPTKKLFRDLSSAERRAVLDKEEETIVSTRADKAGSKPAATGISDKAMAFDPKLPIKWNKATGQPYHYVNGQYVPIQGPIPPQTGGMPVR